MNDKNKVQNNEALSFKEKLRMFNNQPGASKNKKNINNDKNLVQNEKKTQGNQFQNILQIYNKTTIGENEYSKIDSKNKKNLENEKNNNLKSNPNNNNSNETKNIQKKTNNPFIEEKTKTKKTIVNQEKLIDKINKFEKKKSEPLENKLNNNNRNNKIGNNSKEIKPNENKNSNKNTNLKKEEKINRQKNKEGYISELKNNNFTLEKDSNIPLTHREKDIPIKENKNSNNDNIIKRKEINKDIGLPEKRRQSIMLPLSRPLINNENKEKKSSKELTNYSNIKSNETKIEQIPKKKIIKQKQINPFVNEVEKNDSNVNNKPMKKKVIISPNQPDTKNDSIEKRKNSRSNTIIVKTNKRENLQEVLLEEIPISSNKKKNSFCRAFIASSIPKKEIKIIENSEGEKSCCGHEECSQLPAIEPQLIYKYPEKDTKELEITNVLSYLCFPENIKICINNDDSKIVPIRNHRTCLTNQVGDRYYMMMFNFYIRTTIYDFFERYNDISPIKEKIINIQKTYKIQYIYIPYCICLISKYSFFWQMNICLESIFLYLREPESQFDEFKEILSYLIDSVSSPYVKTSIYFPIPNCSHLIELYPAFYQDLDVYLTTPINLIDKIELKNILILVRLLLFEQKILLLSKDYNTLTQVSMNLISLLYPFSWINIYIPIITSNLLKYLESFLPFFFGMNKSLYEKEFVKQALFKSQKSLYIFDIDENTFEISRNLYGKKKIKALKHIDDHVPIFPKKIEDLINNQLAILKSYYKNSINNNKTNVSNENKRKNIISNCIKLKEVFIQAFIELFFEYKKYLSIIGDVPIFNTKSFIKDKSETEQRFIKEFTSTQIFQIFIQNSSSYINKKDKKYYFDELSEEYFVKKNEEIKNNQKKNFFMILNNEFELNMNKQLFQISKVYYIKPTSLKIFAKMNDKLKRSKGLNYISQLKLQLQKDFKYYDLLNTEGRIKNNKKIICHEFNIFETGKELIEDNDKNIIYYPYFITDEEKIERNELKSEQDLTIQKNNEEINTTNNKDINTKSNKEEELKETEKELITDNIDSKLRKIFRSEKVNIEGDSGVLLSSLETRFGKNYFLSLFKLNSNVKQVKFINEDSFKTLFEVITKSLLKLKLDNPNDKLFAMKLLKAFSFFQKLKEKEEVSLIQKSIEFLRQKKFNLFDEQKFWESWVEEDLKEIDKDLFDKLSSMYKEPQGFYYYIDEADENVIEFKNKGKMFIKELMKNMIQVKMNKSFILDIINILCDKFIQSDEFKIMIVSEIRGIPIEVDKKGKKK